MFVLFLWYFKVALQHTDCWIFLSHILSVCKAIHVKMSYTESVTCLTNLPWNLQQGLTLTCSVGW